MINIDKKSKEPVYMQLYTQIRNEITDGTLKEGELLPGSRSLAKTLNLSRNTVDNAYSQLLAEGYIIARKGIGCVVAELPVIETPLNNVTLHHNPQVPRNIDTDNIIYDLTNTSYTNNLFPKNLWRKYTLECLDRLDEEEKMASSQDSQGELYLRNNLAAYLERIRGIHCDASQIVITSGLQQSLSYICNLLAEKCNTVLMEEPGYQKARAVFINNNYQVSTVPVDDSGLDTNRLPSNIKPCALYSTPSHQFPTGVTMPIGRRRELLKWAALHDSYILEDDYDSELRYYAKPIPALQSIDSNQRVIYLGTFSKALSPSIRMGYMILPPHLMELFETRFANYNCTSPLLNQYVIARLIETGQYDRHIRRLNNIYRKRLDAFCKELKQIQNISISGNGSGQYFILKFAQKVSQKEMIDRAARVGVRVYPTMQFWHEKADCPPDSLFLGFSKIDIKNIADCVGRLKEAWDDID